MELVLDFVGFRVHPLSTGADDQCCWPEYGFELRERGAGVLIKFDREDWAFEQVFLAPVPSCFYLERGDRRGERYWGGNLRCAAGFFHGRVNQELQPGFERGGLDTEHLVGVILIGRTQRDDAIEITMAEVGFGEDFALVAVGLGERL